MNVMANELVPVTHRLAAVRWLRAAIAVLVVAAAAAGATPLDVPLAVLVGVALLYLAGQLAVEEAWRHKAAASTGLVGLTFLVDGLFLAWAAAATGAGAGIGAFLVILHVAGVTLLVSYRTGVKVALWHSLLLFAAHELHELGLLDLAGLGAEPFRWMLAFTAVLWVVAVATASFSAVNERELRRRRMDLEGLAALATELEQVDHPDSVAQILADRLRDAFGFSRVAVVGGEDGSAVLATAGLPPSDATLPPAAQGSVLRRAIAERRTLLTGRFGPEDPGLDALLPNARNLLVVPLVGDEGSVQAVVAEHGLSKGSRIEGRVVAAVERFVDHAGLALRAARLLEEVRNVAAVDGLTGAATRRVYDQQLELELSRAARSGERVALMMLDIDHFKAVNDTHGHQVGDDVLRGVAATLMARSRDFDTVARRGGEEFAIIAPGSDGRDALAIAERLRADIEAADLAVPITVSVGVAAMPPDGTDPQGFDRAALAAMKMSKDAGRNRVTLAPGSGPQGLVA